MATTSTWHESLIYGHSHLQEDGKWDRPLGCDDTRIELREYDVAMAFLARS